MKNMKCLFGSKLWEKHEVSLRVQIVKKREVSVQVQIMKKHEVSFRVQFMKKKHNVSFRVQFMKKQGVNSKSIRCNSGASERKGERLDIHVSAKLTDKILAGRAIAMGEIFDHDPWKQKGKLIHRDSDSENESKKKVRKQASVLSSQEWLEAFSIYSFIRCEADPAIVFSGSICEKHAVSFQVQIMKKHEVSFQVQIMKKIEVSFQVQIMKNIRSVFLGPNYEKREVVFFFFFFFF